MRCEQPSTENGRCTFFSRSRNTTRNKCIATSNKCLTSSNKKPVIVIISLIRIQFPKKRKVNSDRCGPVAVLTSRCTLNCRSGRTPVAPNSRAKQDPSCCIQRSWWESLTSWVMPEDRAIADAEREMTGEREEHCLYCSYFPNKFVRTCAVDRTNFERALKIPIRMIQVGPVRPWALPPLGNPSGG